MGIINGLFSAVNVYVKMLETDDLQEQIYAMKYSITNS